MKKVCMVDGGLEKLLKDYKHNQCSSVDHTASVSRSYNAFVMDDVIL